LRTVGRVCAAVAAILVLVACGLGEPSSPTYTGPPTEEQKQAWAAEAKAEALKGCVVTAHMDDVPGLRTAEATIFSRDLETGELSSSLDAEVTYGYRGQPDTATFHLTRHVYSGIDYDELGGGGFINRDTTGYEWTHRDPDLGPWTRVDTGKYLDWKELACDIAYEYPAEV